VKIHTKIEWNLETGRLLSDEFFDYEGSVARCDRSLQRQAQGAATSAGMTAGGLMGEAGGISGSIVPALERFTTTPPGYSPLAMGTMETKAEETTAATRAKAEQEAKLRAVRTRNPAALGAEGSAIAGETARAGGETLQDILARNEMLKEKQRSEAFGELGGMYKTDVGAAEGFAGQQAKDISTAYDVSQPGWLQSLQGILNAGASLGRTARGR
jgi:hypothetical protein